MLMMLGLSPKLSQRTELSQLMLMIQAHDAVLVRCLSSRLGQLIDVHDAGLVWGQNPQIEPANAHDAGLVWETTPN